MSDIAAEEGGNDDTLPAGENDVDANRSGGQIRPEIELLMFALPHHQERLRPTAGSSNIVKQLGCQRNIHGNACPVSVWLYGICF